MEAVSKAPPERAPYFMILLDFRFLSLFINLNTEDRVELFRDVRPHDPLLGASHLFTPDAV